MTLFRTMLGYGQDVKIASLAFDRTLSFTNTKHKPHEQMTRETIRRTPHFR